MGSPERHRLLTTETNAVYSGDSATDASRGVSSRGYLLFIRNRQLYGQSFSASSLEIQGDPIMLAENVGAIASMGLAPLSVSDNGVLVYQVVGQPTRQLVWFDRTGRTFPSLTSEPGEWGPPRLSPDGTQALVGRVTAGSEAAKLWRVRGHDLTQVTSTPGHEGSPIWSPDGARMVYFSGQGGGSYDLYERAVDGGTPQLLVKDESAKYPNDW